jgi:hypothetical protein
MSNQQPQQDDKFHEESESDSMVEDAAIQQPPPTAIIQPPVSAQQPPVASGDINDRAKKRRKANDVGQSDQPSQTQPSHAQPSQNQSMQVELPKLKTYEEINVNDMTEVMRELENHRAHIKGRGKDYFDLRLDEQRTYERLRDEALNQREAYNKRVDVLTSGGYMTPEVGEVFKRETWTAPLESQAYLMTYAAANMAHGRALEQKYEQERQAREEERRAHEQTEKKLEELQKKYDEKRTPKSGVQKQQQQQASQQSQPAKPNSAFNIFGVGSKEMIVQEVANEHLNRFVGPPSDDAYHKPKRELNAGEKDICSAFNFLRANRV